jgi:hypothetical protein
MQSFAGVAVIGQQQSMQGVSVNELQQNIKQVMRQRDCEE